MDPAAAKLIGAGLAATGTDAAAIGVGNLFGQFLQGAFAIHLLPMVSSAGSSSALP